MARVKLPDEKPHISPKVLKNKMLIAPNRLGYSKGLADQSKKLKKKRESTG